MPINKKQLEINVNLHLLEQGFVNSELYYVIADSENSLRFATWDEEPGGSEQKFYFFYTRNQLHNSAANSPYAESYVLKEEPIYPCVSDYKDFSSAIEKVQKEGVAKAIRCFSNEDIDNIKEHLEEKYGSFEKHLVTSSQGQHTLFVSDHIEISISATMVYFRHKTSFN